MSDSNNKGMQDRRDKNYDPPKDYDEKQKYDKAWEVTKAQEDATERKYDPIKKSSYSEEKYWREKDAYDKSWEDTRDNQNDQADSNKSSGCFITTACTVSKNLPDNCYELTTLRNFRDTFIKQLGNGKELIKDYYLNAPKVVEAISCEENSNAKYDWLYNNLVDKSIKLIEQGKQEEAFENYSTIFTSLKTEYLK